MKIQHKRLGLVLLLLAITIALSFAAPRVIEAGAGHEYKFVRLVDSGPMPAITDALNREAEAGWRLDQMTVAPGEPKAIYLVFVK